MLPVAVAWSPSDDTAKYYVLPVLWITPCLSIIEWTKITQVKRRLKSDSPQPGSSNDSGWRSLISMVASSIFTCTFTFTFTCWAPPAERGPSLESIHRVSLKVDLCDGNKIISFKKLFHHSQLGAPQKRKNLGPWVRAQCAHWLRRP